MQRENGLVVLTGASRGIGRALLERYRGAGYRVVAVSRSGGAPQGDTGVIPVAADLATREGIAETVRRVGDLGQAVDILVNDAGVQYQLDLTDAAGIGTRADKAAGEIAINLTAPILLTDALLPLMRRPGGTIVNVTSLLSRHPKASAPVYSASKAGLASFTAALRHQLAPSGIRVVEVVPPLVETDMTTGRGKGKLSAEAMAGAIIKGVRAGRKTVAPGLAGRVLLLNRFVPGLVAKILSKT